MRLNALLLVGCCALSTIAMGQPTYYWQQLPVQARITNLGLPQLGINQTDQVVGQAQNGIAFLWSGGSLHSLGTLGGTASNAYSINDFGVAAGAADTPANNFHPFISNNGGALQDLGTLNNGPYANAYHINFYGDVVGQAQDGTSGQRVAYIYLGSGGPFTSMGTLAGSASTFASTAYGVNNNDEAVGSSNTADFSAHAFSWTSAGGMVDLGTLGGSFSTAVKVNDNGDIVGNSTLSGDTLDEAFIKLSGGSMTAISAPSGTTSIATGLNLTDQIVGLYTDPNSKTKALYYENGTSYDLTTLLHNGLPNGAYLAEGEAIDDNGDIAAIGSDGFVYLLTTQPVPEPCSLLALGGAALVLLRRPWLGRPGAYHRLMGCRAVAWPSRPEYLGVPQAHLAERASSPAKPRPYPKRSEVSSPPTYRGITGSYP